MKLNIDESVDAVYLKLDEIDSAHVAESVSVTPPGAPEGAGYLVLDFDAEGRLLGIEFLRPKHQLRPGVLAQAEPTVAR